MSDLISRQAAIDELYKMLHDCFWADDEELDAVITTLNDLPSAQPEVLACGEGELIAQPEIIQYEDIDIHTGYVGVDDDYPVSVKQVLNITAELGALETQSRVRELPRYQVTDPDTVSRQDARMCLTGDVTNMSIEQYIKMVDKRLEQLSPSPSIPHKPTASDCFGCNCPKMDRESAGPHDISKAKFSCPICGAEMEVTVDEWDEGGAV